jgi:hydroxyacylglutathione hydrolase
MKMTSITDSIVYLEPDTSANFTACGGLLIKGKPKILIDANMGEETKDFLIRERPDLAIISHYHLDHATWGSLVKEHTAAQLLLPKGEEQYLRSVEDFITCSGIEDEFIKENWSFFMREVTGFTPLTEYTLYDDGEMFTSGSVRIQSLETPGHSPHHRSFYLPDENILFTGDMGIDRFGPWYGWSDCNLEKFIRSVMHLKSLNAKMLLTSHGGIIRTNIAQTLDAIIDILTQREAKIAALLQRGLSKEEIVLDGIYYRKDKSRVGEPMKSFLLLWDSIMYDHHQKVIEKGGISGILESIKKRAKREGLPIRSSSGGFAS